MGYDDKVQAADRAHKDDVVCPQCRKTVPNQAAVRQEEGSLFGVPCHIVRVGFHCLLCGHEWGFDPG